MLAGGPFADREGLEKSSSDGLVKELLIWQQRALILPSPSPCSPMSISGTSKKGRHSLEESRGGQKQENGDKEDKKLRWKRERGLSRGIEAHTKKEGEMIYLYIFVKDPVCVKSMKLEHQADFDADPQSIKNSRFSRQTWYCC